MSKTSFGGKPQTNTPADRRLKENKGLPPKPVPPPLSKPKTK